MTVPFSLSSAAGKIIKEAVGTLDMWGGAKRATCVYGDKEEEEGHGANGL